jgi:CpcD/allophycocyanin linker domain
MLGQSTFADSRIFVYEVTGLQTNEADAQCEYPVRSSSSTFLQVPLDRMNQTMQRIVGLGGKIVSIRPLGGVAAAPAEQATGKSKKSDKSHH